MHKITVRFLAVALLLICATALTAQNTFLGNLSQVSTVASTVPTNGDVNPYGIFQVPASSGKLVAGHFLISNFNNGSNLQGTGTTIMDIAPDGTVQQFSQIDGSSLPGACPGGVGLTTALVVLKTGWVVVGSLPTADGSSATAQAGCLLVLNNQGQVVETIAGGGINGPWDMTVFDGDTAAALFVTNVLNGTVARSPKVVHQGTVVRLMLQVSTTAMPRLASSTIIGSEFPERTDPGSLVIGPTGVAFAADRNVLYVADSLNSRIAAIPDALSRRGTAGRGITVSIHGSLNDPLGLTLAPNGDLIAANGNDGNLVEITPFGRQVATVSVDNTGNPPGAGTLFGLFAVPGKLYFVDDGSNTLNVLQ
jgi:SMP-30/Gluconolactonase/LRE-like region